MVYRVTPQLAHRATAQRERILACALARVTDGGFCALTMQTLAEDADIATGSLYRHFKSKSELAAEVFVVASQREVDALARVFRGPGSPAQRLALGLEQFAARAWNSRRLAFALIAEPVDPQVDEQRLVYREAYADLFVQLLREGVSAGEFLPGCVSLSAACLVGAISEVLVGPLSPAARAAREQGDASLELSEVTRHLITFCLRAVGASLPLEEPQP